MQKKRGKKRSLQKERNLRSPSPFVPPRSLSRQSLLDRLLHIPILHRQTPVPKRISPKVAQPHLLDALNLLTQGTRVDEARALRRICHGSDVQLRSAAAQILAPVLQAPGEAWVQVAAVALLAVVAVGHGVVVELYPDEVHSFHGVEGDGGIGTGALRGGGNVVGAGGIGGEVGAEGADEGGVASCVVVFVIYGERMISKGRFGGERGKKRGGGHADVDSIEDSGAKGTEVRFTTQEQVPHGSGEFFCLTIVGKLGARVFLCAAETEHDFLATLLTCLYGWDQRAAIEQAVCASARLRPSHFSSCRTEIESWHIVLFEEFVQEGENYNVDRGVTAHF